MGVDTFLFLSLTINPRLSRCHLLLPYSLVTENSKFSTPIVLFPIRTSLHYTLAIEEKSPWGWERLKAGREGDNRGWDGWMASPTQWTWVWASSRSWLWTGRPAGLQNMGLQTVGHDWATELNWMCNLNEKYTWILHTLRVVYRSNSLN